MDDEKAMFKNWQSDPKVTEFLCWPTATDIGQAKTVLGQWIKGYSLLKAERK